MHACTAGESCSCRDPELEYGLVPLVCMPDTRSSQHIFVIMEQKSIAGRMSCSSRLVFQQLLPLLFQQLFQMVGA